MTAVARSTSYVESAAKQKNNVATAYRETVIFSVPGVLVGMQEKTC